MNLFRAEPPPLMRLRFIARDPITGAVGVQKGTELAVEMRDGYGELVGAFSLGDAHALLTTRGYRPILLAPGVWIADGQDAQPIWPEPPTKESDE